MLKTTWSLLIVAAATVAAILLTQLKKDPPNKAPDLLVPQVRVENVHPFQGSLDLAVSGTVVPHREARIAAEVGGRIKTRTPLCEAGKLVHAGDLLAGIDPENYQLALQTAESEVNQAEIMIRETDEEIRGLRDNIRLGKEQVQLLQDELQRNQRLGDVISRSELDQARRGLIDSQTQLSTRENSLATALARADRMTAGLELARRRLERAKLDLQRTEIRAPFDGVVVQDMVEQDDFVQAGTVLVIIEDTSRVEVTCNLTETDLNWLRNNAPVDQPGATSDESGLQRAYRLPQLPVEVTDSRNPEVVWSGRLDRFDGIGRDELTKATPVKIVVDDPVRPTPRGPAALVRGMFVQCLMKIERTGEPESAEPLLTFPAVAVKPGGFVWTVDGNNRIARRMVELVTFESEPADIPGATPRRMAVVRRVEGGLAAGDQVVVTPLSQPVENAVVVVERTGAVPSERIGVVETPPPAATGPVLPPDDDGMAGNSGKQPGATTEPPPDSPTATGAPATGTPATGTPASGAAAKTSSPLGDEQKHDDRT